MTRNIREERQQLDYSAVNMALERVIQSVPRLTTSEQHELRELLLENCSVIHKIAGEVVIQAQRFTGCFYICLAGLLRNFYLLENGKEFNKSFIFAPGVAGALSEYVNQQASLFSMDCLEDATLLKIPFDFLKKVEARSCVQKLYLHVVETLALLKEKREASLLIDNAELRYLAFLEQYPSLLNRLPDYHIATYIGITPVALSRIKKTLLT